MKRRSGYEPIDSFNYESHVYDTMLFAKKITSQSVRRVIRRIDWTQGTRYEMYRHDYSVINPSPLTQSTRLYDANYYVMNSEYKVYICIDNGSSGINTVGNASQSIAKNLFELSVRVIQLIFP